MTLKWTRTQVMVGKNPVPLDGRIDYTSGPYRIERREYTLPCRSTGYVLFKNDKRIMDFDLLADAKYFANEDANEETTP